MSQNTCGKLFAIFQASVLIWYVSSVFYLCCCEAIGLEGANNARHCIDLGICATIEIGSICGTPDGKSIYNYIFWYTLNL